MSDGTEIASGICAAAIGLAAIAGWLTHVVVCIKAATWGLLIAGALFAPVGVIHGWGCWFGWWG